MNILLRDDAKIAIFEIMNHADHSLLKAQLADSSRKIADLTAAMVYENPALFESLLALTWEDKEPWSLRASRVVAICSIQYPELIAKHVIRIIKQLRSIQSESARRNFLQIFKEADIKLRSKEKSELLDTCFIFLEGDYSIGVKAYSTDIIYKLSKEHPDILNELYTVLLSQAEDATTAYQFRILRLIGKIEKKINSRKSGSAVNQ